MNRSKVFETIKTYCMLLIGVLLYSFAITAFIIPMGLVSGGFGGIGAILYYLTEIPVGVTFFASNIILLAIAYKIMGWKFVKVSLIGSTLTSICLFILQKFITEPLVPDEMFMNSIIGGALSGVGLGLVFNAGFNTGGSDIISLIVNKYKNLSPGRFSLYFNIGVLLLFFAINQDVKTVVFALVVMGVTSYTWDMMMTGNRQSYQFMVMSPQYAEIADRITKEIGRGVTVLDGEGWYNHDSKKVLIVLAHRSDRSRILRLIKEVDPRAFLSVTKIEGVYGKNFDRIKK
ncbi:MAG: YitT family protein [Bacteroidales bacterium]|nr:YitT family protein [Bacteroidales bacterium]